MSTQDRWGDADQPQDQGSSEGGLTWILVMLGLLVLLVIFGGGWMFIRAQQAQRMAMMERDRAMQAEMELRATLEAQKKLQESETVEFTEAQLKNIEKLKAGVFAAHPEAIDRGNKLVELLAKPDDPKVIDPFIGQDAVFCGRPFVRNDQPGLRLTNGIRVSAVLAPKVNGTDLVGVPVSIIMGKIISVDREAKLITVEVKLENWAAGNPN